MTYFGFLSLAMGPILGLLGMVSLHDYWHRKALPRELRAWSPGLVLGGHVLVAVLYTTPWDNYLVATRVWWYERDLVSGVVLGWVPVEEYLFFILQTLATGLWFLAIARRIDTGRALHLEIVKIRTFASAAIGLLLLGAGLIIASGWQPGRYLGLILIWSLPPMLLQFALGADILWQFRKLIATAILIPTVYLSAFDTLAIMHGTWTIDPLQSTGITIGGLPVEEALFFLVTNCLVVFGVTLVLANASQDRVPQRLRRLLSRIAEYTQRGRVPHVQN